MEWITEIVINKRIAKGWGTRAAAVFGWLFAQCQAQVPREECKRTECGRVYRKTVRVRVSCCELGKLLHLSRHTVEAILHKLAAEGLLDVWLPRGEDRTRSYSVAPRGFTLLHRWAGQWHTNGEECSLAWGLDTRVASKVGVNAAIVFQYLWFWSHAWRRATPSKTTHPPTADAWLPYTAAELSRWLPFLSDDVIEDALHTLQAEGLLAKLRQGRVTKWAITDAGYVAMGEECPLQMVSAGFMRVVPQGMQGAGTPSFSTRSFPRPLHPHPFLARLRGTAPKNPAEDQAAICSQVQATWARGDTAHTADEEAWAMAVTRIKAARNRRRRLRRKGLSEWSVLSL